MPLLKFEVQADYDKVIKLREEIDRLEQQLKSFGSNTPIATITRVETQLSLAKKEFNTLTLAAAEAGAEIKEGFQRKIYNASQNVNALTEKIIAQRESVRAVSYDVKKFGDAYKEALNDRPNEATYWKEQLKWAKKALSEEQETLFSLTQEQAKARLSVKALKDEYSLLKKEAGDSNYILEDMKSQLVSMGKNILGGIGLGLGFKELIGQIVDVRGEFQQIETSLQVLLGSEEKAAQLMSEVKDFAKVSPLDLKSTAAATQMMLGFNIEAEKVPRYLRAIGDISMGEAQRFNSLTLAFSQMSATGKLMGQDLNQMINAGFNPLQIMADQTGKSIATLKEEMSKGAISAEMVQQAFIDATEAGGKFYQMSELSSETINGQLSMLRDSMDSMFNSLGESSEGIIIGTTKAATTLIENYETVGAVIAGLVGTYGIYRAALMINIVWTEGMAAAAQKDAWAKGIQTAATKAATIAQAAYNAVANANPYVLLATAVAATASAILIYSTRTDETTDAQKKLNKAIDDADAAFESERINIDTLFDRLRKAKEGTEDYANAQKMIIDQYGDYLTGLVDEKNNLLDVASAYERVTAAAQESARARAMESYKKEIADTYQERYTTKMNSISSLIEKGVNGDKTQKTLLQLIKQDISKNGTLSEATKNSIADAVNQSKKWSTGGTAFVRRVEMFVDDLAEAEANRKNAMEKAIAAFGTPENEYENYSKQELEKLKKIISDKLKNGHLINSFGIVPSDGSKKTYKSTAEAQLALHDIERALTKINDKEVTSRNSNYKTQFDKAKKEWEEAKVELKKIEDDKAKFSTQQYEAAKQREQAAEATYKKLGGDTTGKGDKAAAKAQKDTDKTIKNQEKLNREREDLERKNQSEITSLLEDGKEKRLKTIQQEYDDRISEIKRKREDWIKENKNASMDNLGSSGLTPEQTSALSDAENIANQQREKALQELNQAETEAMREYLKEYGTFQQQKLAIAEEYADKIRNAQTEGDRLSLTKERDSLMATANAREMAMGIDWSVAFEGVGNTLREIARETLSKVEDYMKTDDFKKLSAENKKAYTDLVSQLRKEGAGDSTSPFNFKIWDDVARYTKEYQDAVKVAMTATKAHSDAVKELESAQKNLAGATNDAEKQIAQAAVDAASLKVQLSAQDQQSAQANVSTAQNNLVTTTQQANQGLQNFTSYLGELSNGSLYGFANGITKLVTSLSSGADGVGKSLGELGGKVGGLVGAILQLLDAMGDDPEQFIDDVLSMVARAVEQILSDLPEIVITAVTDIGKIIGGAIQGFWGNFGIDLQGIFTSTNAKEVADATERLTNRNEILCQSIDALKEEMERARGMKTVSAYNEAYTQQEELIRNTSDVLAAQMGYHGAHHSNDYYINKAMTSLDWSAISAAVGTKIGSTTELWGLSPEDLKKIQTLPDIWDKIYSGGKYDKSEYIDNYLELAGSLDELTDKLNESLTGMTFDSMYDNFVDTLMNMDAKSEDFAENVSEYFMRAMLSNKIGELYADRLEAWYDDFAASMRKEGGMTAQERDRLNAQYMEMVNEAIDIRNNLAAAIGYDKTASAYQQGSTAGYSTQLSEDTGTEIVGRATALLDAVYRLEALDITRNDLLKQISGYDAGDDIALSELTDAHLQDLLKIQQDMYMIHTEIRRMLAEIYLELQQIRENTGAIIKPINSMKESLEKIEKNTKEMI